MTTQTEPVKPAQQGGPQPLQHYVIGSGPAGVACAQALLQRGAAVRLLDAGISLEPERAELVEQMRRVEPASWTQEQLARIKEGMSASAKGISLKVVFGSDFPYRECDRHVPADFTGVGLRASLAKGGLSNTWGAAMLPYLERDLSGWPIHEAQLAEHYAAVLKFTGLSAKRDGLEQLFPRYLEKTPALAPSGQAKAWLARLERHRPRLSGAGIYFGQARVSVRAAQPGRLAGCVYCGLCLYGCPYGYIYNSADTLRDLQGQPRFSYEPNVIVTRLRELADSVVVEGYDRLQERPFAIEAARVYLAAGPIPTTQILLRSKELYDQTLLMKDSQYFTFPLALARGANDVRHESLHTLSQVFMEILDPGISPYTVHLQVYSYNDLLGQTLARTLGPFAQPLDFLARAMEGRLLVVQGYLHSDHCSGIAVALRKSGDGRDRLELKAKANPETRPMIWRLLKKLLRLSRQLGAIPVLPMLQVADAGRGFHSGGTFPMRASPAALESDVQGRPHGWQRIHAVDATVLPSVPATTITFSVMANAHRIAWETANLP